MNVWDHKLVSGFRALISSIFCLMEWLIVGSLDLAWGFVLVACLLARGSSQLNDELAPALPLDSERFSRDLRIGSYVISQ
jgi:hypothetical protein